LKNIELDIIKSILYSGFILIPIKKEILELFDSDKIQFQCAIIDDKLILTSPKIKAQLGSSENHTPMKMEALTNV